MAICHKHDHSSRESAQKCWAKQMRSRANKKAKHFPPVLAKYTQVKCEPPTIINGPVTTVYLFYTAKRSGS